MSLLSEGISSGNVRPTQRMEKHSIDGISSDYTVYQIKSDLLFFNDQNDRIATWVSEYEASHDGGLGTLGRRELDAMIEDFIVKSNTVALRKTQQDIALRGQLRPGVVLNDGRVIDGNRRLASIRRNEREGKGAGWFEAVILDDATGSDPKRTKLLELAIQMGEEERVAYDPVDKLVGVYRDVVKNCLITPAEYGRATGMSESEVKKLIDKAKYMEEFLEFCGAPEQYHLARALKVDGPLGEFRRILNKYESKRDRRLAKEQMFANIIIQPQGDITRFVRTFGDVVGTDAESAFRGAEHTALERLRGKMGTEPLTKEKVAKLRADEALVDEFVRAGSRAREAVRQERLLDTPVKKSAEALHCLEQIMPEMLDRLDVSDLADVRRNLKKLSLKVGEALADVEARM